MHVNRKVQPLVAALIATVIVIALAVVLPFSPASRTDAGAQANPHFVEGVDVSGHQRPGGQPIDWRRVAGPGGQQFAFIKATEGSDWTNDFYKEDAQRAQDAGLEVGAYHYARPSVDPIAQAHHFATVIGSGPELNMPPVVDLEVDEALGPVALAAWTTAFLTELERLTGSTPMIYTYRYFWTERMNNTNAFTRYPLWLAAYQNQAPRPVGGWDKISFWQRSDAGNIAGLSTPVDQNVFNGTRADLDSFVGGNYAAGGGVLEAFQVPDSGELSVLGSDSTALVTAILGLAGGSVAVPQIADAAKQFGFNESDASSIAEVTKRLASSGELPVDDLRTMMLGEYSIGDLLILLNNVAS